MSKSCSRLALCSVVLALGPALPAHAYIGPGAGVGAIAVTVAFLVGVVLLLAGLVWYPLKRVLKNRGKKKETVATASTLAQDAPADTDVNTGK